MCTADPPVGGITLHKLKTVLTINDLADAHEALDEREEYDRRVTANQKAATTP